MRLTTSTGRSTSRSRCRGRGSDATHAYRSLAAPSVFRSSVVRFERVYVSIDGHGCFFSPVGTATALPDQLRTPGRTDLVHRRLDSDRRLRPRAAPHAHA